MPTIKTTQKAEAKSVYIHIPFCEHICPYCDFNKVVRKGQPVMDYLEALKQEMELTVDRHPPEQIRTIFVGGGTPTSLNNEQMEYFLDTVNGYFQPQAHDLEFTMEANPGTVDIDKLRIMAAGGVNRLSLGVQSFDSKMLKGLGRIHSKEEVFDSIEWARKAGFNNISIDLMFGLPNQNVEMLNDTLDVAFDLDVHHFSAYGLQIEEGTHFHKLHQKDQLPLPPEDEEVAMYQLVMERMKGNGFNQYEISNFASSGFESQHNLTYWRNEEYYGLGAGAHGYVNGIRHVNAGPLHEYIRFLQKNEYPYVDTHQVTKQECMENMMIMGLRIQEGVSQHKFYEWFHTSIEDVFGQKIEGLLDHGLIQTDGSRYYLTNKGIYLGNDVFASFLFDEVDGEI